MSTLHPLDTQHILTNCLLVSIIDGSIIDLKTRPRNNYQPAFPFRNFLSRRPFPFDVQSPYSANLNQITTAPVCSPLSLERSSDLEIKSRTFNAGKIASKTGFKNHEKSTEMSREHELSLKEETEEMRQGEEKRKNAKEVEKELRQRCREKEETENCLKGQLLSLSQPLRKGDLKSNFKKIFSCMSLMNSVRKTPELLEAHKKNLRSLLSVGNICTSDLTDLKSLLLKFLLNQEISENDLKISDIEFMLFTIFLIKKNYKFCKNLEWTPSSIEALRSKEIKKRSEQNYKVILKRFFKKVISNFNEENKLESFNDLEFYRVNFGEIANNCGEDWSLLRYSLVFNETHVKSKSNIPRKSKKIFAGVLKKNLHFMKQLGSYLDNNLEMNGERCGIHLDYTPILKNKVCMLIEQWRAKLYSNKNLKARLCKFVVDQVRNKKVKLPWGYVEIDRGVSSVRRLFKSA
jgi:hypothetical protein